MADADSVGGRRGRPLRCKSLNEDESCVCVHHWVGGVVLPGERRTNVKSGFTSETVVDLGIIQLIVEGLTPTSIDQLYPQPTLDLDTQKAPHT